MQVLTQTIDLISVKINWLEVADYAFCIKEKVDDIFVMRYLNQAYEDIYLIPNGRKKLEYINSNCFVMWGDEIGGIYQSNDWEVYNSKSSKRFNEVVNIGGKKLIRRFQKKYFQDPKTQKEYIILWSIDIDN